MRRKPLGEAILPVVERSAVGTRPPVKQAEAIRVGGHTIRVEREDDRIHLVLGGVFRLVMTLDEAESISSVLAELALVGKASLGSG